MVSGHGSGAASSDPWTPPSSARIVLGGMGFTLQLNLGIMGAFDVPLALSPRMP